MYGSFTILVHLCEVDGKLPFSSASTVLVTEVLKVIISTIIAAATANDLMNRVRMIPSKAPIIQYPITLASSDTNTQYQYRY